MCGVSVCPVAVRCSCTIDLALQSSPIPLRARIALTLCGIVIRLVGVCLVAAENPAVCRCHVPFVPPVAVALSRVDVRSIAVTRVAAVHLAPHTGVPDHPSLAAAPAIRHPRCEGEAGAVVEAALVNRVPVLDRGAVALRQRRVGRAVWQREHG